MISAASDHKGTDEIVDIFVAPPSIAVSAFIPAEVASRGFKELVPCPPNATIQLYLFSLLKVIH